MSKLIELYICLFNVTLSPIIKKKDKGFMTYMIYILKKEPRLYFLQFFLQAHFFRRSLINPAIVIRRGHFHSGESLLFPKSLVFQETKYYEFTLRYYTWCDSGYIWIYELFHFEEQWIWMQAWYLLLIRIFLKNYWIWSWYLGFIEKCSFLEMYSKYFRYKMA